jgi:hypothetical protein
MSPKCKTNKPRFLGVKLKRITKAETRLTNKTHIISLALGKYKKPTGIKEELKNLS